MPDATRGAYERVLEWLSVYEVNDGAERLACGYVEAPLLLSDLKALLLASASDEERPS